MNTCEKCGELFVLRNGTRGEFWGCSGYPACKNIKNISVVKAVESNMGEQCEFYKLAQLVRAERLKEQNDREKSVVESKADEIITMYRIWNYSDGKYLPPNEFEYKLEEFIDYIKQQGEENVFHGLSEIMKKDVEKFINKNFFERE